VLGAIVDFIDGYFEGESVILFVGDCIGISVLID
jgi:hypothetical protein